MALEMINPYSKYELKRRPTYDEIAGLIGENEKLTGSLPDRRATFFKASPGIWSIEGTTKQNTRETDEITIIETQFKRWNSSCWKDEATE